jgi:hypothetical protein
VRDGSKERPFAAAQSCFSSSALSIALISVKHRNAAGTKISVVLVVPIRHRLHQGVGDCVVDRRGSCRKRTNVTLET